MTAEQLQNARAAAWRQQGNALLTGDDAAAWLREAGLALFLPRTAQIAAPAGSFVEATQGEANATPRPAAIENATAILRRLLASGDVVGLNLLGLPGDQPDFLATEETLPFLFALRGDREWKRGPRGKSSPLVVEVWKALREGALSADEIKDKLGRQLTETAALRALTELWTGLRIEPVYSMAAGASDGHFTRWQLLEGNHEPAMIAGSAMAQGMALSALVSLYLQTSVAATGDEIEAYLAPLASRSRIREAVRGLLATRQIGLRNLGAQEHFFVEGSLPDFAPPGAIDRSPFSGAVTSRAATAIPDLLPERTAPAHIVVTAPEVGLESGLETGLGGDGDLRIEALSDAETEQERTVGEGRKRFVAQRAAATTGDRKSIAARPSAQRKTFGSERKTLGGERKTLGGERKTFSRGPREGGGQAKKPFFAREPWKEDRRPVLPAAEGQNSSGGGERRPSRPKGEAFSSRGDRKPFSSGGAKPFQKAGDRKPFAPRPAGAGDTRPPRRPFTPREGGRPFSSGSDRKPFTPREGGRPFSPGGSDRKPFTPREGGRPFSSGDDRKPFTPREGGRPFSPGGDRKPFTPREGGRPFSPGGDRKPFTPREGGRPFSPGGDRRPFTPRSGGAGTPFRRNPGETSEDSPRRAGGFSSGAGPGPKRFSPAGGRPARPGAPAGAGKPGGKRPRTSPFTSSGKPRSGVAATGRPGPRAAARPGGTGKPPSGRKPGAGPRKPGGKGPRRDG